MMSPRPSRRLNGHALKIRDPKTFPSGECSCGYRHQGWFDSTDEVRDWHRQHKADVAARLPPRTQER